jgi:hypothetical protein
MKIEYTDEKISSWGGLKLLHELIEKIKIKEVIESLPLPEPNSNRGISPIDILVSFWISVWTGASRFVHIEILRYDEVLQEIFSIKRVPSQSTLSRFFNKFDWERSTEVFVGLLKWFYDQLQYDNITLDLDSTVLTRYGRQEGVKVGYNPQKPGRGSHHPLLAFMAEMRMVVNAWLRVGNSVSISSIESFILETFEILKNKKVGVIRADSGFFSERVLNLFENKGVKYIVAAKIYGTIRAMIGGITGWTTLKDGIQIKELTGSLKIWKEPRRIIVVRKDIKKLPKSTGKLLLFDEIELGPKYRYSVYVTNMDLPAEQIWMIYRERGDAENRIKELKYDFGIDGFCMKNFWATEAAFRSAIIAYNIMSLFRQVVLQTKSQPTLNTMKFKCFALGSKIVKRSREKILKISLVQQRRAWLDGLFSTICNLSPPFHGSIA